MSAFDALLDALDRRKAAFLDAVREVAPEERSRAPSPHTWSPRAITEHLVLVEEHTAAALERGLDEGGLDESPSEAKVEAVLAALGTAAQIRIPDSARHLEPTGEVPLEQLEARWGAVGERLRTLAERIDPAQRAVPLMRHPAAGPIRFDQALRLLEAHVGHHVHQLARTIRALAPPAR